MGQIDDACREVVAHVEGAVACGVVDLDTGMLLGVHDTAQPRPTLDDVVAAACMNLFRGPSVARVEALMRQHQGLAEDGHHFQEIQITSESNYHFAKVLRKGKAVVMLVTKKTTNLGMGWAQLKSAVPGLEPLIP